MSIRSRELADRLDVSSAYLTRWRRAGLIRPEFVHPNRAIGATWPDWALRMGKLLRQELTPGEHRNAHVDMLRQVAEVLALFPDVPMVVISPGHLAMPAWSTAQAVAWCRITALSGAPCSSIVTIPTVESPAP